MPCNTAHNYAARIVEAATIPFLDMVELAAERVAGMATADFAVGILASPAVRLTGIYDRAFARRQLTTLYPSDEQRMLAAIRAIKRSSSDPAARETLREAADQLVAAGAQALLVACSEFSIVSDAIPDQYRVVDSMDVLADAVVDFATTGAPPRGAVRRAVT